MSGAAGWGEVRAVQLCISPLFMTAGFMSLCPEKTWTMPTFFSGPELCCVPSHCIGSGHAMFACFVPCYGIGFGPAVFTGFAPFRHRSWICCVFLLCVLSWQCSWICHVHLFCALSWHQSWTCHVCVLCALSGIGCSPHPSRTCGTPLPPAPSPLCCPPRGRLVSLSASCHCCVLRMLLHNRHLSFALNPDSSPERTLGSHCCSVQPG